MRIFAYNSKFFSNVGFALHPLLNCRYSARYRLIEKSYYAYADGWLNEEPERVACYVELK